MAQGEKIAQLKFRLPAELNEQIEHAASEHRWAVSEEIRRRLAASFEGAPPTGADPKTAALLEQINVLARIVTEHYGTWHETPRAYLIFKRAVELGLPDYDPNYYTPAGEIKPPVELAPAEKEKIETAALMAAAEAAFKTVWSKI